MVIINEKGVYSTAVVNKYNDPVGLSHTQAVQWDYREQESRLSEDGTAWWEQVRVKETVSQTVCIKANKLSKHCVHT